MIRSITAVALLVGTMSLGGCYKVTYNNGSFQAAPAKELWRHRAIYGLVEISDEVALNSICPSGFGKAESKVSFMNGLVSYGLGLIGMPGWVYSPATVTVWCSDGAAYRFDRQDGGYAVYGRDGEPEPNLDGLAVVSEE